MEWVNLVEKQACRNSRTVSTRQLAGSSWQSVSAPRSESFHFEVYSFLVKGALVWRMVSTTSVETGSFEMCPLGGHVHNFHHSERDRSYPPPERGDPSRRKSPQRAAEKRNQVQAYSARQNGALLPIRCILCRTPGSRAIGERCTDEASATYLGIQPKVRGRVPKNQGFLHMSKTRRQRRVTVSMRSGFPLGENPLVLSHHCRGLIYSRPNVTTLDAAAIKLSLETAW